MEIDFVTETNSHVFELSEADSEKINIMSNVVICNDGEPANYRILRPETKSNASPDNKVTNLPVPEFHHLQDDSDYHPSSENSSSENIESENNINGPSCSEDENDAVENDAGEEIGRPKKGRKRKFKGQTFKTKKKLQHANKPYYTEKGRFVAAKNFLQDYQCNCARKCANLINEDKRKHIFDNFYKLANYDAQTAFIAAKVREIPVKRKRNKISDKRSFTRTYCLETFPVCKDFFMNTLRVSSKRINTALCKFRKGEIKDSRGEKQGGKNKLPEEVVHSIISHIKKFPTYKSHYCRAQTESRYLNFDITERKMYDLYKDENKDVKVSFTCYKNIFYKYFNLRRKPRIKDTCSLCDLYNIKLQNALLEQDKEELKLTQNLHLESAEMARTQMKHDFEMSKGNDKLQTLTYDMEKTLPLPSIPTNLVFYKRQLWLYNEGVHCENKGYCFIWKEGEAGRGAQEVGSCLRRFVELFLKQNTETLIMWSDSCGGQNRNIKIVLMLKHLLCRHPTLKTIYFKFLISGHSYLPNDSDFSDIEKAIKLNQRIYTMQDYANIMKNCRRKTPLVITEMKKEHFFSVADLEKEITNRKTDTNKEKISWLRTRVIKIEKEKPFSIFLKYTHNENDDFHEVLLNKNPKRQPPLAFKNDVEILWPNGKEISNKKLEDIKSLLPFIPKDAKSFYRNLNGMDFDDDLDGYGENLDFEPEEEDQA